MNLLKQFPNEILITLISLLTCVIVFLIKNFITYLRKELKEVLQKIELIKINLEAIDYAIEKSDKKKYIEYRDKEKLRLLNDNDFIKNTKE